jgi:hypothetical protein
MIWGMISKQHLYPINNKMYESYKNLIDILYLMRVLLELRGLK